MVENLLFLLLQFLFVINRLSVENGGGSGGGEGGGCGERNTHVTHT